MEGQIFNVTTVKDKGEGCIALRHICKGRNISSECLFIGSNIFSGTVIFKEKALITRKLSTIELDNFIIEQKYFNSPTSEIEFEQEKLELKKIYFLFLNLSSKEQQSYLELCFHNRREDKTLIDSTAIELRADLKSFSSELFTKVCSIYKTNAFSNGLFLILGNV